MAEPTSIQERTASRSPSNTPYQLDLTQTTKACKVLQQNIADARKARQAKAGNKRDLLSTEDGVETESENSSGLNDVPVWMILTGKKHIVDRARLKPNKIQLPHSLNTTANTTICLITTDPQRLYKDTIADPSFPSALRTQITRVIGIEKLRARYKSFEAKRQLAAEHDFFFADSRIWTYLPKILGKVFFQGGAKRPIPVEIEGPQVHNTKPGQVRRSTKGTNGNGAAKPAAMVKELEKALHSTLVNLSPSSTTAVKVATAGMTPEQSTANIKAVMEGVTTKLLPKGWRNVRAVHIKGPNTPALPIWLASELWEADRDVLEEKDTSGQKRKRNDAIPPNPGQEKKLKQAEKPARSKAIPSGELISDAKSSVTKRTARKVSDPGETERKQNLKKMKTAVVTAANAA